MPRPAVPVVVTVFLLVAGCGPSRPARIIPPALDPKAVTAAVMAKADANADGAVGKTELAAIPALTDAVAHLDENHDGGISAAELQHWLDQVKESRIAITSYTGEVRHHKRPLANATVKLVPEAFMGTEMKAAEGVTDAEGRFSATIPNATYQGVNCGLYRVEITGQGNDGRPLPAKYNTDSVLGAAVGGQLPESGFATFVLE